MKRIVLILAASLAVLGVVALASMAGGEPAHACASSDC